MPPYVAIPHDGVGGDSAAARSGYPAGAFAAFSTGRDPSRVDGLQLPEGVGFERSERRRAMLEKMDDLSRQMDQDAAARRAAMPSTTKPRRLLSSPEAKAAFDLSRESPADPRALWQRQHRWRLPLGSATRRGGLALRHRGGPGLGHAQPDLPRVAGLALSRQRQAALRWIVPMPRYSPTCANEVCWSPRWWC